MSVVDGNEMAKIKDFIVAKLNLSHEIKARQRYAVIRRD
jgi:hypothetical protein